MQLTAKEIQREVRNTELMVLDALQTFTRKTGRHIHSITFGFKQEDDGTQKEFSEVNIVVDDTDEDKALTKESTNEKTN